MGQHIDYFGKVVELYRAATDESVVFVGEFLPFPHISFYLIIQNRILFRASTVAKANNCTASAVISFFFHLQDCDISVS